MNRIEQLRNSGYITQVLSDKDLDNYSEQDLISMGILTSVGFDGNDDTEEELPVIEDEPTQSPVVDDPEEDLEDPESEDISEE